MLQVLLQVLLQVQPHTAPSTEYPLPRSFYLGVQQQQQPLSVCADPVPGCWLRGRTGALCGHICPAGSVARGRQGALFVCWRGLVGAGGCWRLLAAAGGCAFFSCFGLLFRDTDMSHIYCWAGEGTLFVPEGRGAWREARALAPGTDWGTCE